MPTNKLSFKVILILATVVYNGLFFILNRPIGIIHEPVTFVDSLIPVIPVFIIPYLSYHPYPFLSLLYFGRQKKSALFWQSFTAFWITLTVSYLIFYFYQTTITRPAVLGTDIYSQLIRWLYSIDNHYAALPSLHVGLSTLSILGWLKTNSSERWVMILWGVLIIFSTVLVKQHYFLDLVAGVLLAWISFQVTTKLIK